MIDDEIARLATALGARLHAAGWRIATAESCTGGLVAGAITSIAGSSQWFDAGIVAYSNAMKAALLGVDAALLATHGAVSEATALAMAEGARHIAGADIAVAVTGIAGPGGATPGKPVGTVCFAWALADRADATTLQLDGDRTRVRRACVIAALEGAIRRSPGG